jgi:hypothetical protein
MRLDLEDINKLDDSYKKDYSNYLWKENDEVMLHIYKTKDEILLQQKLNIKLTD